jgi:hypothetical protein
VEAATIFNNERFRCAKHNQQAKEEQKLISKGKILHSTSFFVK